MPVSNKIQLITYPDSLGNNLKNLHFILNTYFKDAIGGVHILPFYPSSADRGFAPLTYLEVDNQFGDWHDIQALAKDYELVVDIMLNHISRESVYFKDYVEKGANSEYADLFLTLEKVFGTEDVPQEELAKVYRPRPSVPYIDVVLGDKTVKKVWCSFTPDQIDLDLMAPKTRTLMQQFVLNLAQNGAKMIRIDAAGYAVKKPGTNCFFLPETYDLIDWIKTIVEPYGVDLLPEVHSHYSLQLEIAQRSDYVYDFALPMLVLNAIYFHNAVNLKHWISIRPDNQVTTLDTHDGIGAIDAVDLMTSEEIDKTVETIHNRGGNNSLRASGSNADNLDIYQVNCTYYSALGEQDDAYIVARAIQFFVPGIPQVYYVGMLAGVNDITLLEKTNHGRDINRHYYSTDEIANDLERPVVQRLLTLMKFRNSYPAFNGSFTLVDSSETTLIMEWVKEQHYCKLVIDLVEMESRLEYRNEQETSLVHHIVL